MAPSLLIRAVILLIPGWSASLHGFDAFQKRPQNERQQRVVKAFLHGWRGYKAWCWGSDELLPVSRTCTNEFGGLGAQIIDAMDTLWLMNLKDEYLDAKRWVIENFTAAVDTKVSVFETCIRIVGGLLSAHFLTGDLELLEAAKKVGYALLRAWKEGPIPLELVNLVTGEVSAKEEHLGSSLAEVGTLQLELNALAMATGDLQFRWRSEQVMDSLGPLLVEAGGLLPIMLEPKPPMKFTNLRVTLGGRGDSFYEYLLKQWLLTNRTEERYRMLYQTFVAGARSALIGHTSPSNITFVRESDTLEELRPWLEANVTHNRSWADEAAKVVFQPMTFVLNLQPTVVQTENSAQDSTVPSQLSLPPVNDSSQDSEEELVSLDAHSTNDVPDTPEQTNPLANDASHQGQAEDLQTLIEAVESVSDTAAEGLQSELSDTVDAEGGCAEAVQQGDAEAVTLDESSTPQGLEGVMQAMQSSAQEAGSHAQRMMDHFSKFFNRVDGSANGAQSSDDTDENQSVDAESCASDTQAISSQLSAEPAEEGSCSAGEVAAPNQHGGAMAFQQQIMKMLQEMMGNMHQQQQRMVYVSLPEMRGNDVCATHELLASRRWDLLHKRMRVVIPEGSNVTIDAELLETVAGIAEQQLSGQCQKWAVFKMDHLACFLPGVLALGVLTGAAKDPAVELEMAAGLAEACANMWLKSPLGLAPEAVSWNVAPGRSTDMGMIDGSDHSSLRPETVESLWYLYCATGDRKYQEWGWRIFTAIERHAWVETGGFSGIESVRETESPRRRDRMETFVLSETFKYLFLLLADGPPAFDFTKVVFNTEAHPLPVFDPTLLR